MPHFTRFLQHFPQKDQVHVEAVEEQNKKVTICDRIIIDLQFVFDIDALAEVRQKLETPGKVTTKRACGIKCRGAEIILVTNYVTDIQTDIKVTILNQNDDKQ